MAPFCISCMSDAEPLIDDNEPFVIILLNPKGGAGKAKKVMEILKDRENCNVIDILRFAEEKEEMNVRKELENIVQKNEKCRIVFGGGDGTITWGFQILDEIGIMQPIAILPLGTANEISKCTGWSNSFKLDHLKDFLYHVRHGPTFDFDIWNVSYSDNPGKDAKEPIPERRPSIMGAFLSFGTDAQIANKFHLSRQKKTKQPSIAESKISYAKYDLVEMFRPFKSINKIVKLKVDGEEIQFNKNYSCLQLLNINSMAGGVDFFGKGKSGAKDLMQDGQYTKPLFCDKKVEIIGETSVHHYNLCFLGLSRGRRLGQGNVVEIESQEAIPMEVDGEPFLNPRGTVVVTSLGSRKMVLGNFRNANTRRGIEMD
ncbi:hypothetical protein MHBO_001439 [Bonamia ostreae]|uniref:Diacylglycerol kinase n=1 Tax=Bonamia ostreae TaxID=126728 RepID=A0ABV2AJU7_9EUKA